MPVIALTVIGLMLLGNVLAGGRSAPSLEQELTAPVEAAEPRAGVVNLQTELSAPMFHGTVQAIDRKALRVTIRTDFGRLVPVTVERCETIQHLQIGDRIRLDVDAQGVVRALETPHPTAGLGSRCPEAST
jgi:hypothetical protein